MNVQSVWKLSGAVGSTSARTKTSPGGWKAIGENPLESIVWTESYSDVTINFFASIEDYMAFQDELEVITHLFFP